ncbi:hypothetical protein CWI37_0978p0040 [Hamiltosporidium tvaerminnensis]|uniref:Uncharacterized protein n=1 Tax=Hamiltosporidium tvaerminnensis TaxID=1176355 RepID=A0A4Q9KZQ1_9MICR|nr:hypothetical protein CWI37_0978p0040 [Hamiltosporidium tvaerminnensis]
MRALWENKSEEERNAEKLRINERKAKLARLKALRENISEEERKADLTRLIAPRENKSEEERHLERLRLQNLRKNRTAKNASKETQRNKNSHRISRKRLMTEQPLCIALNELTEFDEKQN